MKVRDAIKILETLPQDAHLVASTEMQKTHGQGIFREGAPPEAEMLVDGFSAEELKKEDYEFFFFEKEGLVVLGIVRNSSGQTVSTTA